MFFTDIIFDLDNTLYDYTTCHEIALLCVCNEISNMININDINMIKQDYNKISKDIKHDLNNTGSSHNRTLYFNKIIEKYNLPLECLNILKKKYWECFYDNILLKDGVLDLFIFLKNNNIKIHILTDFTINEQLEKIDKLEITNFISTLTASEEIGVEKPSSKIFTYCLNKIKSKDVLYVGDNYEKDICGANNVNIYPFYYNTEKLNIKKEYTNFNNFNELLKLFENMLINVDKLEYLSKYCGERFDLIQAGGGNISIKDNTIMYIKSSGCLLSDVTNKLNYSIIDNTNLIKDIQNNIFNPIKEYNIINDSMPSMETFMHSILKKYTIHLHPIQINNILVGKNYKHITDNIENSIVIDYLTPGEELCKGLLNSKYNWVSPIKIIFLLNHGVIFTTNKYEEIIDLIENTLLIFEEYSKIDFKKYKYVNDVSKKYGGITYISEDKIICENIHKIIDYKIIFPDQVIYCGENMDRIILDNDNVYINSNSINKCKYIESVLKSYLMIDNDNINELNINDINSLNISDMEKYRKNKK